ncbi:lysophospholipid acyltransferase family protein [Flavobacterium tibetense]|uniref:Lipid A biosynthesis acyltransferase n=1 Tax=Flavobacterium tibetense TaxID=2233533 RepID=A0A365NZE0_9FLAO|nr:lysophospholipid acyltransferase family protein [Flavobacterium tibetense]RBA27635.1 lipid A biosynthesis acyltransferase [Flavobacterium tibetense]
MQLLLYLFFYPILWLISILPFRLLYILSDFVFFLVYRVIKYRKRVVRANIAMALPHLSAKERQEIERKFFIHMCDMFLEMIKTMSISRKEIEKRYVITNLDSYLEIEKKNKSIALLCAHYASYEWAVSMNYITSYKGYGIYKRIANKYFDKLVHQIRSKFKAHLITTKETISTIEENQRNGVLGLYGFASDQSPKSSNKAHWGTFMGIETPIHVGAELLAKRLDMTVVFLKTKKVKRGYYEATIELMTEDAKPIPNFEISEAFMKKVEQQIYEAPEFYLWTHKRWKHRR